MKSISPRLFNLLEHINSRFSRFGGRSYQIDEPTTIFNHSLQTAWRAKQKKEPASFVVACLLHDYGHVLQAPISPSSGIDDKHELLGALELARLGFPPEVTEPVRLHVTAKRYKFGVSEDYRNLLSKGSLLSLELQGGRLSHQEHCDYINSPYFYISLKLRDYDDCSKSTGAPLTLFHFLPEFRRVLPALCVQDPSTDSSNSSHFI